jgi:hypothetical protein
MIRMVLAAIVVLLVGNSSVFAQGGGHAGLGCWKDVTRGCVGMAIYAEPTLPWAPCTMSVCEIDEIMGVLVCTNQKGLWVTDTQVWYHDVVEVDPNEQGRSNHSSIVSPFKCGEVWWCSCNGRANGQSCIYSATKVNDYFPTEYHTFGALDCVGM